MFYLPLLDTNYTVSGNNMDSSLTSGIHFVADYTQLHGEYHCANLSLSIDLLNISPSGAGQNIARWIQKKTAFSF